MQFLKVMIIKLLIDYFVKYYLYCYEPVVLKDSYLDLAQLAQTRFLFFQQTDHSSFVTTQDTEQVNPGNLIK